MVKGGARTGPALTIPDDARERRPGPSEAILSLNRPGIVKQPLADVQMDECVQEDSSRIHLGVLLCLVDF
jgi:hypothetical protein